MRVSRSKVEAVLAQISAQTPAVVLAADTIVLAADTVGVDGRGDLLAKPADADEARAMLRRLRGVTHLVATHVEIDSVGFTPPAGMARSAAFTARTWVTMRDYSDAEIEAYVDTGDPLDKAGGYAIQHPDFRPVANIEGCYSNVVGLPLCQVKQALAAMGIAGINAPDGCDCPRYTGAKGA
jgi:MAF protein